MADLLTITTGIPASVQESSFMNATLQCIESGPAVSIAVYLPNHADELPEDGLVQMLKHDFKHLTDIGYQVEIQIGPDDDA